MADRLIRVGVLTPHATMGPEAELPAMAPGRVMTCVARVSTDAAAAGASSPAPVAQSALDEAAEILGRGALDTIVYASTSSAYGIGFDADVAVVSRLSRLVGIPVSATCVAAVQALRAFDVERIAILHPPWFDAQMNELGAAYFRSAGFDPLSSVSAALSPDPDQIDAAAVYEWTSRQVSDDAEAVFIGGNGFRAAGAIAALEAATRRPVLTANQVLLWSLLAQTGATFEISGYGRLFMHKPRPRATLASTARDGDEPRIDQR
jgi:maleate isomerase